MTLWRSSTSLIGLDLGGRIIKAAQLRRRGSKWRLSAALSMPRQTGHSPAETASRLAGVLERQGFTGDRVVVAAPVGLVKCDLLDLPPRASGAPIEQLAAMELAHAAKLEPGEFETACWDVATTARNNGTAVLAMALRHKDADDLLDPLESQGLEVVAVDAQACAMQRVCRSLLDADCAGAVLDLGWTAGSFYLINQQTVLYQRTLWDSGLAYVHKAIMAEHGLGDDSADLMLHPSGHGQTVTPAWLPALVARFADQLCDELHVSLAFARRRFPEFTGDRLLMTGGGSTLAGLTDMVAERLAAHVTTLAADQLVDLGACQATASGSPLLAAAMGLAMYGEEP